jgi:hypothetical protein
MLDSGQALAAMKYDFKAGRALIIREGWATIQLGFADTPQRLDITPEAASSVRVSFTAHPTRS